MCGFSTGVTATDDDNIKFCDNHAPNLKNMNQYGYRKTHPREDASLSFLKKLKITFWPLP
jgi:hypothetical protein